MPTLRKANTMSSRASVATRIQPGFKILNPYPRPQAIKPPEPIRGYNMTADYTSSAPDPFATSLDQINTLINELLTKYSSFKAPDSSMGDDDPLIQAYLSQAYGGARDLADSYSSRTAGQTARGSYNSGTRRFRNPKPDIRRSRRLRRNTQANIPTRSRTPTRQENPSTPQGRTRLPG